MSQSDWIKLLVKFNGKCCVCGKLIKSGEYAFWSKISKSIKHLDCYAQNNLPLEEHEVKNSSPQAECLFCKVSSSLFIDDNHTMGEETDPKFFFICNDCVNDPGCYSRYQYLLLEKMNKIVKLKS
ncbi:MAG TPA: hypothetical protein VFP25_03845 [Nitrososphaeraceae archaeon]|nr:hypothetical protein [Nitrososphaeraceae archaeon]